MLVRRQPVTPFLVTNAAFVVNNTLVLALA